MRLPGIGARRDHAERFLFVSIAGFVVSVAVTRWFLALTGYPKVGGGDADHVLWGGLLLVVAATLPLLFVGRRVLLTAALAGGIGIGLFIDEIGKFLTETNDYFFAPAAPMIYGALLLFVTVWVVVRRSTASSQDLLHASVDALRDSIDGRLTRAERDRVVTGLELVRASDPVAAALAARQISTLASAEVEARLATPGWIERGRGRQLLERWLPVPLERALVVLGLLGAAGLAALSALLLAVVLGLGMPIQLPAADGPVKFPDDPAWAILILVIATGVGLASGVAAVLFLLHRDRAAVRIAVSATMVNLVAGGLITFYVAQFGAMTSALGHLLLLGLVLDLDRRLRAASPAV
jgi:hypothetical protein